MRVLTVIMIAIVLLLQYRIWFGQHGVRDYRELQQELARQEQINNTLTQRNQLIEADIRDLRSALEAVEERARNELGFVRPEETFFRLIPKVEEDNDS
ncbi:cell division protein FtsB [Aliidiomarina haloalkalitolerans]|uniref:Cell division protein FtsB n=1 Tax=Aliidiomarina haloalkalitolerans TaxID=859059 RepID=A0A432VY89_9GAMM|nr:cell division protein FtsB [Aliidiomarina haloalkalitolerans]RUO21558.1 cell division protein FtsB [Aliidiomarina haloalkalitolerans]